MKPKDLKFPFSWQQRHPLISDRVFYVPHYYNRHQESKGIFWEEAEVFGNNHDVYMEYCSGNGAWIVDKALQFPERNWVAVEKRFDRVCKIWSKIKNLGLQNLFVVCGEAYTFTRFYVKEDSVKGAFVNFPDPWPKDRHAKHRLFQELFVLEMSRVLQREGEAIFVTDDETYSLQMIDEMTKSGAWEPAFQEPYYVTEWPEYGSSYFDQLWREKGRVIRYLQFINQKKSLCRAL